MVCPNCGHEASQARVVYVETGSAGCGGALNADGTPYVAPPKPWWKFW